MRKNLFSLDNKECLVDEEDDEEESEDKGVEPL